VRNFAAWLMDALMVGTGAGLVQWGLFGGGFPYFTSIVGGAAVATLLARNWRLTPGRRLIDHFANLS
jgi:hypothetical protein